MNSIDLDLELTDPQTRQIRLFSPICEPIGIIESIIRAQYNVLVLYHYANFHVSKTTKVDKSENIPIILILQTNKNFALINLFRHTLRTKLKQRIVHRHGDSNINCNTVVACVAVISYIFFS